MLGSDFKAGLHNPMTRNFSRGRAAIVVWCSACARIAPRLPHLHPYTRSTMANTVQSDFAWARLLRRRLEQTPVAASLADAVIPLGQCASIDSVALWQEAQDLEEAWLASGRMSQLGLPDELLPFAVAIHLYTLEAVGGELDEDRIHRWQSRSGFCAACRALPQPPPNRRSWLPASVGRSLL